MSLSKERKNEIIAVLYILLSIFTFLSLSSNDASGKNYIGIIGHYYSLALLNLFGFASYLIIFILIILGWNKFKRKETEPGLIKLSGALIFLISITIFLEKILSQSNNFYAGGIVGNFFNYITIKLFGDLGSWILMISLLVISFLLTTEFLFFPFFSKIKISSFFSFPKQEKRKFTSKIHNEEITEEKNIGISEVPIKKPVREREKIKITEKGEYQLPPISLLKDPEEIWQEIKEDYDGNSRMLEEALKSFDVASRVVNITKGPVITRYEIELATGVKVSKIVNLADDLSLVLKAVQVRIAAPVPGKGVVGIEVPNRKKSHVFLKELLEKENEIEHKSGALLLSLGKNIAGEPYFADLARMPHLLIAGTTGSGKSVCVNSIIINILFKYTPEEVKFIIIDPKRVEMIGYDGIPHLLIPVIIEIPKASIALKWAVKEMENRYEIFAHVGSRNIEEYNKAPADHKKIKEENDEEKIFPFKLPYIVIIIDELADLMMVARKDVETTITRLAQMARAVGIHLILATQRPSVDVITGLIKANFPSRVAFQVSSRIDSRTILDANGAEKLLGEGDMLFYSASLGASKPIRIQGAYISNTEINNVVEFVKNQAKPTYMEDILKMPDEENIEDGSVDFDDPLFEDAVKIIQNSEFASVSLLQRKMKIGYNRAARLMDMLEKDGIVGPADGSKPRTILVRGDWFETEKDEDDE